MSNVIDWMKLTVTEIDVIRQRGRPRETQWGGVREDTKRLGFCQVDAQDRNKWRRKVKRQPAKPGHLEKWLLKRCVCVCVCVCVTSPAISGFHNVCIDEVKASFYL